GSVVLFGLNGNVAAEGTTAAIQAAIDGFKAGTLHVFDVSKFTVTVTETSNTNATVDGEGHLTAYLADVDGDNAGDTDVIHDGYFDESGAGFRSAPYFDIIIDGVTNLNVDFG
ncbi:MAG: BMP family ABC transporter substrate-binding protein, partial [Clostridia bacterium]|nr:BMP family ABC transporter substrate-binding protein [Clostridia bacterium]